MTSTLDVARFLVRERDLSVIPIERPGKKPIAKWAEFQHARPTDDNLRAWFGNGRERNVGIVTGAISNIVAIDCDNAEAIAWADAHLPPTPMITRTAKGEHRFYRHPGVPVRNAARIHTGEAQLALDVRGDGGYVVGPTSLHPSGAAYERVGSWPPVDELPVFDPTWLDLEDAHAPAPERPPTPSPAPSSAAADRDRLLRRARAYVDRTPPAIEGQGGDAHTFMVCCRLVRGFDLTDDEALTVLAEWNARCVPPWRVEDLLTKIAGARKYGDEPIGARVDDPRHARTAPAQPAAASETLDDESPRRDVATKAPAAFNLTDSGNAEYLAARHGDDLRYDHRRGRWLLWQRHRWQPDADAEIHRIAKRAMRHRFTDAAALDDPDARQHAAKWAIASESRPRLEALLYLAQAERPIADAGDGWDVDPTLLGVPNGVVDLQTGGLRAGRRDDRISLMAGVEYHATARSELWDHALCTILPDDELRDFFHRAIGNSATGDMRRDCWFLGVGTGRNGKGTLYHPIRRALGDYALELPGAIFDLRCEHSPYELAYLPGRRFVTSSETGDTIRLNHDRIKQLTGGDPMSAANKYEKSFTFAPASKLWLACNTRPRTTDDTAAFWARVFLIPFTVSFVGREDRSLRPALVEDPAHQAAVLAWIVRGAVRYYAEGLDDTPAAVRTATDEYREDNDPLAGFLAEAVDLDPNAVVGARDLYEHYGRWADDQRYAPKERVSATMFGRLIGKKFDHYTDHDTGVKHYAGLARRVL